MHNQKHLSSRHLMARLLPLVLVMVSLGCTMPFVGRPTPTSPAATLAPTQLPTPTPTPQALPPALVESNPPQSVEVPLDGPITLYFNQPMDRASVEAALTSQMQQEITFTWIDNSTVVLYLSAPLEPETQFTIGLDTSVRSAQGLGLLQPVSLNYRAAGYLHLAQALPEPEAVEIDPSSAVVATFNRPIVPLGAEASSLPPAFSLQPSAEGRGEWVNTSTFIFYPEPPLEGGKPYTVALNPELKSTDGGPLQDATSWSFTTALPRLESIEPSTEIPWRLDAEVILTFNQPMDPASVEANFSLRDPAGNPVPGSISWDEANAVFTFKPDALLARDTVYTLGLNGQALARGGSPLGQDLEATVITVPPLSVTKTEPPQGGTLEQYQSPILYLSAPIQEKDILQLITIDPPITNPNYWWDESTYTLSVYGDYAPNTSYTLTISPGLTDVWGGNLEQEFRYSFNTAPYQPDVTIYAPSESLFVTPSEPSLVVQAVNVGGVPLTVGSMTLEDYFTMLSPDGYDFRQSYQSSDQVSWQQPLSLEPNKRQLVELYLSPDQRPLSPGIYIMRFDFPEGGIYNGPYFIVVSNLQVTLKSSPTDVLTWVVDLRNDTPLAGAPVTIYDETGKQLASGETDDQGIFQAQTEPRQDPYTRIYAVVSQPGQETFGLTSSGWNDGSEYYEQGIRYNPQPPGLKVYYYTDRPIYRPGQTVYFKVVARQAYNGRYTLPDLSSLTFNITSSEGQNMGVIEAPLNALGTSHGEYALPASAPPGYYYMTSPQTPNDGVSFQVANYRKPEIDLQVDFSAEQVKAGETLDASINARYFFGAPAGNLLVNWALYAAPSSFYLPGYQVGPVDIGWLDVFRFPSFGEVLGTPVSEGQAKTDPGGKLVLDFPSEPSGGRIRYTLEATIIDESGFPVSARDEIEVNPAEFYIGARPDAWIGRAGEQTGFEVQVVDWEQQPFGVTDLRAEFQKVIWVREDPPLMEPGAQPKFTPQYTLVGSTDFITNEEGKARLSFTPPEPGTYQLDIFDARISKGDGPLTGLLQWIGGPGEAIWPNLPNSRLRLTADKETYVPGEIARIFVPNPLGKEVQALITVERGIVMRHQVLTLGAEGYTFELPLSPDEAPNVYLSVTLLGRDGQGNPDFRLGYLNLPVEPIEQTLQVSLTSQPEQAGPGEEVSFEVLVQDADGNPVQGEFSLAVVDEAALALADPNSPPITLAFYDEQPLGVTTSLSLSAYTRREKFQAVGGGGGGGGEAPTVVRESFPDTAYWEAEVITGPDGKARVTITLPDTLTTWQVDTRGTTEDTRVGEAQSQVVTSKELLVRPVTPRFLVVNDHVQMAAVAQNNTNSELQVEVTLQGSGFQLDDPASATQQVSVPAGGRTRLGWWGTAQDAPAADLVFSVQGADASGNRYQDAARPAQGALPILRFTALQTFRTSGTMEAVGEITELVSLPRSYEAGSGELDIELAPSLAAAMMTALETLETAPYESTEQILSSFLPNLETYRTLQEYGLDSPELKAQLDKNLNEGMMRLTSRQNLDGGWGWWQGDESDRYMTTYVLFGLSRARAAGIHIDVNLIQRGLEYLRTNPEEASAQETWQLDRQAFEQFTLAQLNEGDLETAMALYEERNQLNPWGQALLTLAMEQLSPGSAEIATLISDLETSAIRTASGAHWEINQDKAGLLSAQRNMQTTLSNSAIVLYMLAQRDPGAPLAADAVRYLMANRGAEGGWYSTYTTAWTLMALDQVIKGTGELGGDFAYSAALNDNPVAQGQAGGTEQLAPVAAQVAMPRLYDDYPNALVIERSEGQGRLYYSAALRVSRPVEDVTPLSQGLNVERAYYPSGEACPQEECPAIQSAQAGEKVTVRLTLTLPNDAYYLAVEDYIPAGAEILDTSLKTSQLGEGDVPQVETIYDPRRPFDKGWGGWWFNPSQVYDDHIAWSADYLPAGTYELSYTLTILQVGQYRLLPARTWQLYFPEVQANSSGGTFEIMP